MSRQPQLYSHVCPACGSRVSLTKSAVAWCKCGASMIKGGKIRIKRCRRAKAAAEPTGS
jgi:hypothetical protein